jgi:formylmethanofuran dehydrogenase subunit E
MPTNEFSVYPPKPPFRFQNPLSIIKGRDGVYVRCDKCRSLMHYVIEKSDGRQLCRRCYREGV